MVTTLSTRTGPLLACELHLSESAVPALARLLVRRFAQRLVCVEGTIVDEFNPHWETQKRACLEIDEGTDPIFWMLPEEFATAAAEVRRYGLGSLVQIRSVPCIWISKV